MAWQALCLSVVTSRPMQTCSFLCSRRLSAAEQEDIGDGACLYGLAYFFVMFLDGRQVACGQERA